ncbi:nuclear transport factor 2 family protein [Cerasicoccus fimbriatus]|uniref:nuclear transport factor 2 family protein n=1 Tax=Cerasicoccus fimbriatus TaxID=3014554 RepID=UPI0022B52F38|nr:nuclear transport factor 2 family protein [Cerasicoccus sp. TK19100]
MKTNTTDHLPKPVAEYIEAVNRFDAAAAAACFTSEATVHDEGGDHVGAAAIECWVAKTSHRYRPHATITNVQGFGEKLRMAVKVAGDFPGSPIELDYELRVSDGKILELSIQ